MGGKSNKHGKGNALASTTKRSSAITAKGRRKGGGDVVVPRTFMDVAKTGGTKQCQTMMVLQAHDDGRRQAARESSGGRGEKRKATALTSLKEREESDGEEEMEWRDEDDFEVVKGANNVARHCQSNDDDNVDDDDDDDDGDDDDDRKVGDNSEDDGGRSNHRDKKGGGNRRLQEQERRHGWFGHQERYSGGNKSVAGEHHGDDGQERKSDSNKNAKKPRGETRAATTITASHSTVVSDLSSHDKLMDAVVRKMKETICEFVKEKVYPRVKFTSSPEDLEWNNKHFAIKVMNHMKVPVEERKEWWSAGNRKLCKDALGNKRSQVNASVKKAVVGKSYCAGGVTFLY
jgi:hypothetical protein